MRSTVHGFTLEPREIGNYAFMSEQLFENLSFRVGEAMVAGRRFIPIPTSEADLIAQHMEILINTVLAQRDEIVALRRHE